MAQNFYFACKTCKKHINMDRLTTAISVFPTIYFEHKHHDFRLGVDSDHSELIDFTGSDIEDVYVYDPRNDRVKPEFLKYPEISISYFQYFLRYYKVGIANELHIQDKRRWFKLNQLIHFKMKPLGVVIYQSKKECIPGIDPEGYCALPICEFMNIFGPYMSIGVGSGNSCIEQLVYFDNEDLLDDDAMMQLNGLVNQIMEDFVKDVKD